MRKSEMTLDQKRLRSELLVFLKNKDWDLEDTNWFEENLWSQYELSPIYDNGKMNIELELNMEESYLNFILMDNNSGKEVFIVIKPIKNITNVFKKINDFKDAINSNNFREHINSLFEVTDSIFADDGSNNLVELSPNE